VQDKVPVLSIAVLFGLKFAFDAMTETGYFAGVLRVLLYGILSFFALGLYPFISVRSDLLHSETLDTKPVAE
jgi:hypothetical protein